MTGFITQRTRLNFRNLPLIEAAVRVSLKEPLPLTFRLLNSLHNEVRADFPDMEELTAIEQTPGQPSSISMPMPLQLAGAKYVGNADGLVLSIQDHLVAVRWLRRSVEAGPAYPRFERLRDMLWRVMDTIAHIQPEPPRITVVNMLYANLLQAVDPRTILQDYFSPAVHMKLLADGRVLQEIEAAWRETDDIDFRFKLQKVTARVSDEETEGFRLVTVSGVLLHEPDEAKQTLDAVHEQLQAFFRRLISERAKREWGLTEGQQ